jgi:oligosaccharyltransferase complex subunit delta (ribophorin II)
MIANLFFFFCSIPFFIRQAAAEFGYQSGQYNVQLIVADANLVAPTVWTIGTVDFTFPQPPKSYKPSESAAKYQPLTNIEHVFRQPEKRPPTSVSSLFTMLVLAPVPILLIAVSIQTSY